MAKLEITISRATGGTPIAHETFDSSCALTLKLIASLEALIADLPGRHRTTFGPTESAWLKSNSIETYYTIKQIFWF